MKDNQNKLPTYILLGVSVLTLGGSAFFVGGGHLGDIIARNKQSEYAYAQQVQSQRLAAQEAAQAEEDAQEAEQEEQEEQGSDQSQSNESDSRESSDDSSSQDDGERTQESKGTSNIDLKNQTLEVALNIQLSDEERDRMISAGLLTEDGYLVEGVELETLSESSDFLKKIVDRSDKNIDLHIHGNTPESDINQNDESSVAPSEDASQEPVIADLRIGEVEGSVRLRKVPDRAMGDVYYYVVEEGDILEDLAAYFETPIGQLMDLNYIEDADEIYTGEILIIPDYTE